MSALGVPYAEAGVDAAGRAMATCPRCDTVFAGGMSKAATRLYAIHFVASHDESTGTAP